MAAKRTDEVEVIPGVLGPREFSTDSTPWIVPETGHQVGATIVFDEAQWQYVCDEVRVRRSPNVKPAPQPVTTDALRKVPIAMMMKAALLVRHPPGSNVPDTTLRDVPNPDGREPWGRQLPEDLERSATDRTLAWVAHIHLLGHALGEAPTKSVQDMFEVSRATAGRWVAEARKRGLLPVLDERATRGGDDGEHQEA